MLERNGRNPFEGHATQRVYSVLSKTRACDRIVDHPRVLALLDRLLMPNYLLSMLQLINIQPGEQAQMLHTDDAFYPLPRPRKALGIRRMLGYSIHPPFIGQVDGMHPKRLLERSEEMT